MQRSQILIIEDDEGVRDVLRLTLELEGYRVLTAADGKEGLDTLKSVTAPCLILLDLMMPVMNGWAFAEALQKDMILMSIPVVVVTAFSEKASTVKKARAVIKKPVDVDALLRVVRHYCGAPQASSETHQ